MAEYKDNLLGEANGFLEVLEQVSRLAPLDKPVLIIGERGTGKELIANRLHYLSSCWQGPFISLNCSIRNYSAMKLAHLLARKSVIRDVLNVPTAAHCFLMSWRPRPCWCRKNCCA